MSAWRAGTFALGLISLCLTSCGRGEARVVLAGEHGQDGSYLVVGTGVDGSTRFARRIDGVIADHRVAPVTESRPQSLLITTKASGRDQGKVIVLDSEGHRLAEYGLSGDSPYAVPHEHARYDGEMTHQLLAPVPDLVAPLTWRGRRFLALVGRNFYSPSSFVLLEAVTRDRLEERAVFWNFGHIHHLLHDGPHVAVLGYCNAFQERGGGYPLFAALLHLEDAPDDGAPAGCLRGTSPGADDPPTQPEALYRHYVCLPAEGPSRSGWVSAEIREGALRARTVPGLGLRVDLESGDVEVDASDAYAEDHARRRAADPSLPALEDHLVAVRRGVRSWSR